MTDDYTDVRDVHPKYEQVPCKRCDRNVWVHVSFTYNHDEAFCHEHIPDAAEPFNRPFVEVRI